MTQFQNRECRFNHDIPAYLEAKPADLHMNLVSEIQDHRLANSLLKTSARCSQRREIVGTAINVVFFDPTSARKKMDP